VDGDGRVDILAADEMARVYVWRTDAAGSLKHVRPRRRPRAPPTVVPRRLDTPDADAPGAVPGHGPSPVALVREAYRAPALDDVAGAIVRPDCSFDPPTLPSNSPRAPPAA
jgi:hypothetical protein